MAYNHENVPEMAAIAFLQPSEMVWYQFIEG